MIGVGFARQNGRGNVWVVIGLDKIYMYIFI